METLKVSRSAFLTSDKEQEILPAIFPPPIFMFVKGIIPSCNG